MSYKKKPLFKKIILSFDFHRCCEAFVIKITYERKTKVDISNATWFSREGVGYLHNPIIPHTVGCLSVQLQGLGFNLLIVSGNGYFFLNKCEAGRIEPEPSCHGT